MDPSEWSAIIERFIQDHIERANAAGVVIGMSGGLDSAVAGALAARALGTEKVFALLMPAGDSDPRDAADAQQVCDHLRISSATRGIQPIVDGALMAVEASERALANLKARARMMVLYAEAQSRGALVCGTGNKSELLVGYFTKHGDGGNDLQPLGDLYKTQVFELARHLDLPTRVIEKAPSAGLWDGQTDEQELGMSYERLDAILKGIELNRPLEAIAQRTGEPLAEARRIATMVRRSEHKRHASLVPKIGARTIGIDWRRPVHWDQA